MKRQVLFEIKKFQNIFMRCIINDAKINFNESAPSLIQVEILLFLLKNDKCEVYQKDLERMFSLRRSTISGVLKTMENKDLIKRLDSVTDHRVKRIVLTKHAKDLYVEKEAWFNSLEEKAIWGIDPEKLKIFLEVLDEMTNNIKKIS